MSDDNCPRHPGQPVVAACLRFDRRYCEIDFGDPDHPVVCLSAGTHCSERPRCMLWVRMKDEQRAKRRLEAEAAAYAAPEPVTVSAPPSLEWVEIHRGPLGQINLLMIFLLYDEEFRVKIVPAPDSDDFMLIVPKPQAIYARDVVDYYVTKWAEKKV